MTVDAPTVGRRRVDPGALVTVKLGARILDDTKDLRLVAAIPADWSVSGAGGGTVDPSGDTVTWESGDVQAGTQWTTTLRLRAPGRSPDGGPTFDAVLQARLENAGRTLDAASVRLWVAPAIIIEHVTFAFVDDLSQEPTYLPPDMPLGDVGQLEPFRIRFQVRNADLVSTTLTPRLQYRIAGTSTFADVPNTGPVEGLPFYLGTEWRPVAGGQGTLPGSDEEWISTSELREQDRDDDTQRPADGRRLGRGSVARAFGLVGDSYSEIEFTVKSSLDLPFNHGFELRLVDGGRPIYGAVTAVVRSGSRPPIVLSPGQRNGVSVGPPVEARPALAGDTGSVDFPLVTPDVISATWAGSGSQPIYRLAIAQPVAPEAQNPPGATSTSPHTPDTSLVSDTCAICHRAHVSPGYGLLSTSAPQSALCFTCHDGNGSSFNTVAQYANPAISPNDTTTRSYYRHDATVATTHTLAGDNEFGGASNRHSECVDCHNSHDATATAPIQYGDGWSVSGRERAVSGVAVANGIAGSAPTYTFLDGGAGNQPSREYQVCLKCHSSFTTLNGNAGQTPSRYVLDKAVEFDTSTVSFHPVEAAGTNGTTAMRLSLSGSSPYKQWSFQPSSTIRCVNCHSDPGGTTAAGGDLAPHASQYRGLLLQNYRDGRYVAGTLLPGNQGLKPHAQPYSAVDFALCFLCHSEAPFRNASSTDTNFEYHQYHVSGIPGIGAGNLDIDAPAAGQGDAICAECHFRIHGTALAYNTGDRTNTRLVNFAPNVLPYRGVITFVPPVGSSQGGCTLICHGYVHTAGDTTY